MKTLVIHPSDITTDFLKIVYSNKPGWTIINDDIPMVELKQLIKEHDRIVMLGHGTDYGLIGFNDYVIDSTFVYLLKDKLCFAVWCNCNLFFERYKLTGFYTGMIISELDEADMCDVESNDDEILKSNDEFAHALEKTINSNDKVTTMLNEYNGDSELYQFNMGNIYHT